LAAADIYEEHTDPETDAAYTNKFVFTNLLNASSTKTD